MKSYNNASNYKAARVGGIGLQRYHHADIRVKNSTSCSGVCDGKSYVGIGDCCSEFWLTLSVSSLVAIVFAAIGVAFALRGVLEFRSAGTTVDPRVPDQSVSLVIRGVYRISRNPMYAGFLLVLIAWGMFLSNLASFVLLPVFVIYMNRFQITPEERHMREKFGEAYREYEAEVRRWI